MSNLAPIISFLKHYDGDEITLMEVCGTHTVSYTHLTLPTT